MDIRNIPMKGHTHCRGFSLVELMIALVITLILLAGIGQIFLSSKKSYTIQSSLSRIQESGRYAMDVLTQDLRRAGYWGGNADITAITGTQAQLVEGGTCAENSTAWARSLNRKVFGLNDSRGTYGCLPATTLPPQDIVVVRYAAPWQVGDTTTPAFLDDHFYLRSSLFEGRLFTGDENGDAENQITAAAVRTSELIARAYFINPATNTATNRCGGGTVPSLYRMGLINGTPTVEEIAYGVENLQVQYGIDNLPAGLGDGSVDSYVDAFDAADANWDRIIAVRIWLLVRAECPDTGYTNSTIYSMAGADLPAFNDSYRRKLYSSTVQLRNR
jgi:type IV pilus assembly protein PilW